MKKRANLSETEKSEMLNKLNQVVCHSPEFTKEETLLIRRLLEAYRGWIFVGRMGKLILLMLAIVAAGMSAYEQIIKAIKTYLVGS